jgi:hypothetical protein
MTKISNMEGRAKICWMCGNVADSREHLIKKSDVTAMFGKGSYKNNELIKKYFDTEKKVIIQGSNSRELKYCISLCKKCNNDTTQPFDIAYEIFSHYLRSNINKINKNRIINTNIIFGMERAKKKQQDLFRYFIKAFGCHLSENDLRVPDELRQAILGKSSANDFRVSVCTHRNHEEFLYHYPLLGNQDQFGNPVDFFWGQFNGWFTVFYAYNCQIPSEFGEDWRGTSRKFKTGIMNRPK